MSFFLVGKNYARNNSINHIKIPNSGLFEFNKNIENGFKSTSAAEVVNRVLVPVPSDTHTDIPLNVEIIADNTPFPDQELLILSPTGLSLLDTRNREKIYTLQEGTNGNTKYIALLDKKSNKATIRTTTGALILFPGDSPVKLKYFNKWRIITSGRSLVPSEEYIMKEHTGYNKINNIISKDGNKLIIGIPSYIYPNSNNIAPLSRPDDTDIRSGAILVYNKINNVWNTTPSILSQQINNARIGYVMAASADGNTIVTTSYFNVNISILIFKYVNDEWHNTSLSIGAGTIDFIAISADGTTIAFTKAIVFDNDYSINIFEYSFDEWILSFIPINYPPISMTIDSTANTIVTGFEVQLGGEAGLGGADYKISIYTKINTIWTAIDRTQNLSNEGYNVSISANGDRIITTISPYSNGYTSGAIVIYDKINNIWNNGTILLAPVDTPISNIAISADGNTIVNNINSQSTSGIFVYNYSNTGWKLHKRLTINDRTLNSSISISGDGSMVSSNIYNGRNILGVIIYE
jgi:hypothetical protein